ncbi:uncharacterized protein itprid1 [Pempheris klunzingeri]|uniref:uncharacterized protein itprid1 n=1 Tax=Pempheris klunzingeri TaxID=3127111 RepID=UPI00397F1C66
MTSERVGAKRANLVASRVHWSHMDLPESTAAPDHQAHGSLSEEDSVRRWLTSPVTEEDAKHEPLREAAEPLRRNPSSDDDLALGVEASLYGNQGVRTVQDFLRWSRSSPALSRWNSLSSATSGHSVPFSVMDILNLWNDDPEEVLLDLGFGCDEPDLSGRIPARFINHQSQARGINLQVFLDAQKNRLDLENPDVSDRFRQLEVLQQVTTAFSSLVGSSSSAVRGPQGKDLPPEARERRRRVGMLFRRASKKSLSQIRNHKSQDLTTSAATSPLCAAPELLQPPASLGDKKVPLKRVRPGLESVCLSPLAEEQGAGPDPQPQAAFLTAQDGALRPPALRECHPLTASTFSQRKRSLGQVRESFEMEEVHSFDESSVAGIYMGGAENSKWGVIRTNSCQSDSSGFLEEPFIPPLCQQASPGPDLIKAPSGLSGGSSERPGSPSPSPPHTSPSLPLSPFLPSSGVDKCLPSSPYPPPEHSLVFVPSPSPGMLCVPKSDLRIPETETPPDQDLCPPGSLLELVCENLPSCSSSLELQNMNHSQSPTFPSPPSFKSLTSSPIQPTSLIRVSQEINDGEDAPSPYLSTLSHDCEGTTYSTFSSVPPSVSSPSASPNFDCQFSASYSMSSLESDCCESPTNTQSEQTQVALHANSPPDSSGSLSLLPSSLYLPPSAPPDFHCPCPLVTPPSIESLSQSPVNSETDSGGTGLSDPLTTTQMKEEESPPTLSELDEDNPLAPPSIILDSSRLERGCVPLSSLSPSPSISVCQSALSPQSHDPDCLIDPADLTERSVPKQDTPCDQVTQPCNHDDNTDPVQHVIHSKMDHLSLDLQGEDEGERHTDAVQTREAVVYLSDPESSDGLPAGSRLLSKEVWNQTEIEPQVPSCSLQNELSTETKPEELSKVSPVEINGTESESPKSSLVLHDGEADSQDERDAIQIESLDLIFQTSVDGSEDDNEDVDAFFLQLDTEERVYWAEPIQVSNPSPALEVSYSHEFADGPSENAAGPRGLHSFSSTIRDLPLSLTFTTMDSDHFSRNATASSDRSSCLNPAPFPTPSATSDLKPSNRSVSVQMSSSLTSHIVHRKDVPYTTDAKRTLLPGILPLDTSTPFRAVQSWTDLHIQQNTLKEKNLSDGALHTVPNQVTVSTSASQTTHRPTLISSSSPSCPLLSNDWQSHDCLPGMARNDRTVSASADKGLWPDEEEEVDRTGNEDEKNLWTKGNETASMACCCSCDHKCTCCTQRNYNVERTVGNVPYSLDELEEMMLCLQQFRSVLSNMEEQLSEDQAAVYSALSDQDREKVRDIEELRQAVKQEAAELEMQLNELAHHYDDSLKMKMHRLLDEQSLLCSQLRVFLPGPSATLSSPTSSSTVATQCCLLPRHPQTEAQRDHVSSWSTWDVASPRQSPPGSESLCEGLRCSPTKAEKLDVLGFLQRKAQRPSEMTTGCMRSTLEPEHRLMAQESIHYQEVLESLVDRNSETKDDEEEPETLHTENQEEDQLKKPRRKDTPILNCPPHIPGVRLLKAEKQMVHFEDEEQDEKD